MDLLGVWAGSKLIGGLCYYLLPIHGFASVVQDPVHALVYTVATLAICTFFAKYWLELSGASTKDVS